MKTRIRIWIVLFLMGAFLAPISSQAKERIFYKWKSTKTVLKRQANNWGLGFGGGIFEGVGLHGVFFPMKGLSMDLGVGTLAISNNIALGVKYFYAPDDSWSLYGFVKSAYARLARFFWYDKDPKVIALGVGPGIQYMHRSGFAANFEAGPGIFFNLRRSYKFLNTKVDYERAGFMPQAGLNFSWYF